MASITYYVVQAYDLDEEGNLIAREAQQATSSDQAKRFAVVLAQEAAGVMAFSRTGDPDIGEYGEPTIILKTGALPDEWSEGKENGQFYADGRQVDAAGATDHGDGVSSRRALVRPTRLG
jgi:hypothetical protein